MTLLQAVLLGGLLWFLIGVVIGIPIGRALHKQNTYRWYDDDLDLPPWEG